LELAVARAFQVERRICAVSATSGTREGEAEGNVLEVVHLNGGLRDDLEGMVFSALDYAVRGTRPDAWYDMWATDVLVRPVVFVGTELDESTLWQYVEYRRRRGPRGTRELRPGSCLVCPSLNPARKVLLRELHVDWVPMTAEEFAGEVLSELDEAVAEGHRLLRAKYEADVRRSRPRLVSELASVGGSASAEYLLGQEPTWADIQHGVAVARECDEGVYEIARMVLSSGEACPPLVVTGTAGSGKSTCLMRLALRLSAEGVPVYWLDEQSNVEPHSLREVVLESQDPLAILVDDADLFGRMITGWARELPQLRAGVLFGAALRSPKVDGLLDAGTLGIQPYESAMPHLTDPDIDALLEVLDRYNRLGVLKGKSRGERVEAFRREAGRQLLVAMIQATSGKKLREKVFKEFAELPDDKKLLYAIVCLVHSQRYTLDRDEILIATGEATNELLNSLETLVQRHVIVRDTLYSGYRARHRMIADELVNAMEFRPFIGPVLQGVCFAFATRVRPDMPRSARPWRRLIRFVNHDYITQIVTPEVGREMYGRLEDLLTWDYHYWLQRGSLEVEKGDLELATNFLGQAKSLAPGERNVETEYAYLLTKKAARNPTHPSAAEWFDDGREALEELIETFGKRDPYPCHVLGSQGLAWARHGNLPSLEKRGLLAKLLEAVNAGIENHPRADDLRVLKRDLEAEWLLTAVSPSTEE
jgi:hypothetical protein